MSKIQRISALALVASCFAAAQTAPKVGGLIQVWYDQVMDNNLRNNSVYANSTGATSGYYNLRTEYKEDGFSLRRVELNLGGSILPELDYYVMIDPSINTTAASTTNSNASYIPTILQDAYATYHVGPFMVRLGQLKTQQTYEAINFGSGDLMFAERSQLARVFGDKRDRGALAAYQFGDPKEGFGAKVTVGIFDGMSDLTNGKANDTNAQKDFIARVDFNQGSNHKFGAYTLRGSTDQSDKVGALLARTWSGATAPTAASILANKDKTTNLGAFYAFDNGQWHFDAEYLTGLLGRRFASVTNVATTATALREGLDQKFEGYYLTGAYTMGHNRFLLRYDYMNYNSNDTWYTAANPYLVGAADYTPKYKETTLGYTYALDPAVVKSANIKVNYILRSKNFLKPLTTAGQTSEQGGNTLMAAFQVAF